MSIGKALVTGGAGFIGSHVVRALLDAGAEVRVLDNFSTGARENLEGLDVEVRVGDIRDAEACGRACEGVDVAFHLAAYISVPGSVADPVLADSINVTGAMNVLLAARDRGARRLVFSSSAAVYGDTPIVPTPEDTLPKPLSPYGLEKLYGEHLARLFFELYGLETVCLRYFNVYGPRQNPRSEYAAVIPKFIERLLAGQTPTIYGDGGQTRDFLFVEDVARANLLAAEAQGVAGEVFNVAGGSAISVNELAEALARAVGSSRAAEHGPARAGDIRHSCADTSKARRRLGFEPRFGLADGLARTVAFVRSQMGDGSGSTGTGGTSR
jgi:nucleoside-diphosphate-sugar epimerase